MEVCKYLLVMVPDNGLICYKYITVESQDDEI